MAGSLGITGDLLLSMRSCLTLCHCSLRFATGELNMSVCVTSAVSGIKDAYVIHTCTDVWHGPIGLSYNATPLRLRVESLAHGCVDGSLICILRSDGEGALSAV